MDQFIEKLVQLESPLTDAQTRQAADQWLVEFRSSSAAWAVAQSILANPSSDPRLRLPAAQIFAWKCKRQSTELSEPSHRISLVQSTTRVLQSTALAEKSTLRALCVALANLVIQSFDVPRPLDSLNTQLNQNIMLEFLTILPGECEDAYSSQQKIPEAGAAALQIKQRAQDWCVDVLSWLVEIHKISCTRVIESSPENGDGMHQQEALLASAAVVRCFAAWSKWGCLFHADPLHCEYLIHVSGSLITMPSSSKTGNNLAIAAGVEALSEVIEHSPEALDNAIVRIIVQLPQHAAAYRAQGIACAHLFYIFSIYCSTNSNRVAALGAEGAALRAGLLEFLCIPLDSNLDQDDDDELNPALTAVDALSDVLEALLQDYQGDGHIEGRISFVSDAIGVLLQLTQAQRIFECTHLAREEHDHNDISDSFRAHAEVPIELCAQMMSMKGFAGYLAAQVAHSLAQQPGGAHSVGSLKVIDVALYAVRAAAGVFTEHTYHPSSTTQPPSWLVSLLSLYAAAHDANPRRRDPTAPLTQLNSDILSSFSAIAPAIMPMLRTLPGQQQQGFVEMILEEAHSGIAFAVSQHGAAASCRQVESVNAAADAVRALFSYIATADMPVTLGLIGALDNMMSGLQQSSSYHKEHSYQSACQQLVVAAVHAVRTDEHAGVAAKALLLHHVVQPFIELCTNISSLSVYHALNSALANLQVMLNAFESYADGYEGQAIDAGLAASSALQDALSAFLTSWPHLITAACNGTVDGAALMPEISNCMISCIRLHPSIILPGIESLLKSVVPAFFLPGGHVLHRTVCVAIETLATTPETIAILTSGVINVFSSTQASTFFNLRGGDANPNTVLGMLSFATCFLREARQWHVLLEQAPVLHFVELALQLAASNTPCNHRDVSQRAVAALSSVLALTLDASTPLHPALLATLRDSGGGGRATQGLLVTLFSLNSAAFLPKIVSLMSDIALLAVACCNAPPGTPLQTVIDAAGQILKGWLEAARHALDSAGVLQAETTNALLVEWNWVPVLQYAAMNNTIGAGGASAEMRRSTQRAVRQLVDAVRRSGAVLL